MWLLPILVVIVLVVSILIKAQEFANQQQARKPGDQPGDRPPQRARTSNDFDRFLQDIERTRQRETRTTERKAKAAPMVRPAPAARPPEEPIPLTVEQPLPRMIVRLPAVEAASAPTYGAGTFGPLPSELGSSGSRASGSGAGPLKLDSLLRSRDSVRVAFILHEVLGPPRSRRSIRG
jgi:hypothetical protein